MILFFYLVIMNTVKYLYRSNFINVRIDRISLTNGKLIQNQNKENYTISYVLTAKNIKMKINKKNFRNYSFQKYYKIICV